MEESTQADWAIIGAHFRSFNAGPCRPCPAHLKLLDGDYGGFPIDRLQHSLQTATRATAPERASPMSCAACCTTSATRWQLQPPDIAAAILKPFVDESCTGWSSITASSRAIISSTIWDEPRHARSVSRHEHFEEHAAFCELYDQTCVRSRLRQRALVFFEPMVRRVLARPINSLYKAVGETA
jgi:predicted HD phosphohydrolase